jgi:hypothetical protein
MLSRSSVQSGFCHRKKPSSVDRPKPIHEAQAVVEALAGILGPPAGKSASPSPALDSVFHQAGRLTRSRLSRTLASGRPDRVLNDLTANAHGQIAELIARGRAVASDDFLRIGWTTRHTPNLIRSRPRNNLSS